MKLIQFLLMAVLTITTTVLQAQMNQYGPHAMDMHRSKSSYTCPMHPQIAVDKPGKCSICGMNLVKSKQKVIKMYTCPMHPDKISKQRGKCSECGMDMPLTQMAYCCTRHTDVASNKRGTCPVCHRALVFGPKANKDMDDMSMYACPMHHDVVGKKPGKCSKCGMEKSKRDE